MWVKDEATSLGGGHCYTNSVLLKQHAHSYFPPTDIKFDKNKEIARTQDSFGFPCLDERPWSLVYGILAHSHPGYAHMLYWWEGEIPQGTANTGYGPFLYCVCSHATRHRHGNGKLTFVV